MLSILKLAEPAVATAPTQVAVPANETAPARRSFKLPDSYFAEEAAKAAKAAVASVDTPAGATPASPAGATPATPEAGSEEVKGEEASETTAQDGTTDGTAKAEPSEADKARRRADRAYRKAAEERVRREHAEKQAEEARQALARARQSPSDLKDAAPKLEDFASIEEFGEAQRKYGEEQALKKRDAETAKKQAEEVQKRQAEYVKSVETDWEEKALKGAEKYEDWDEKVGDLKPTAPFVFALMRAENGHDIAHHLGTHAKDATRIASLPPLEQAFEIGLLSAKLAQPKPAPKQPSKAPAPITPMSGASDGVDDGTYKQGMSPAEYLKVRKKVLGATRH